jgi:hypothetical protein
LMEMHELSPPLGADVCRINGRVLVSSDAPLGVVESARWIASALHSTHGITVDVVTQPSGVDIAQEGDLVVRIGSDCLAMVSAALHEGKDLEGTALGEAFVLEAPAVGSGKPTVITSPTPAGLLRGGETLVESAGAHVLPAYTRRGDDAGAAAAGDSAGVFVGTCTDATVDATTSDDAHANAVAVGDRVSTSLQPYLVLPVCFVADVPTGTHRSVAVGVTTSVQTAAQFCAFVAEARSHQPSPVRLVRRAVKFGRPDGRRLIAKGRGFVDLVGVESDGQTAVVQTAWDFPRALHVADPELHRIPFSDLRCPPQPRETGIDWKSAVFAEQATAGSSGVHFVEFGCEGPTTAASSCTLSASSGSKAASPMSAHERAICDVDSAATTVAAESTVGDAKVSVQPRAVVVKRSSEPACELACSRLGLSLGLPMPAVAVLNSDYGEGAVVMATLERLALLGQHR